MILLTEIAKEDVDRIQVAAEKEDYLKIKSITGLLESESDVM